MDEVRIPKIGTLERLPGRYAISDDGRVVALLTRDTKAGEDAPAAWSSTRWRRPTDWPRRFPVTDVSWKGGVVASAGWRSRRSATEVSLLLENDGRGLMLSWDVETGKLTRNYLEQAGLTPPGIEIEPVHRQCPELPRRRQRLADLRLLDLRHRQRPARRRAEPAGADPTVGRRRPRATSTTSASRASA